jgi:hypothetical protein
MATRISIISEECDGDPHKAVISMPGKPDLTRGLILPKTLVDDLAQEAIFGPGQERHLGD